MGDVACPECSHTMSAHRGDGVCLHCGCHVTLTPEPCPVCHGEERSYHEIDELEGEVERLRMLLTGLVEAEDQPCRFDHHGYCQEHGWFGEPGECYTRLAREAVGLNG